MRGAGDELRYLVGDVKRKVSGHGVGTLSHELDTLSHEPDTLSHEPDTLSHEPDTLGREPDTLGHEPNTLSGEPGTLGRELDTSSHEPNALGHEPNTLSSKPVTQSNELVSLTPKSAQEPDGLGLKVTSLGLNAEGSNASGINMSLLREVVMLSRSRRQTIGVWSPLASAVLWYVKKTVPEYSISDDARDILEIGLEKKYPELFREVKKLLG